MQRFPTKSRRQLLSASIGLALAGSAGLVLAQAAPKAPAPAAKAAPAAAKPRVRGPRRLWLLPFDRVAGVGDVHGRPAEIPFGRAHRRPVVQNAGEKTECQDQGNPRDERLHRQALRYSGRRRGWPSADSKTRRYHTLWCSFAQLRSTRPLHIASKAPSMPMVPM